MPTSTRRRAVVAAVTGVATTVYYAAPDLARSRAARGWLKASCLGALTVAGLPSRDEWVQMRADWERAHDAGAASERVQAAGIALDGVEAAGIALPGPAGDDRTVARVRRRRIATVVVVGGVATLVTVGVIAAGERLVGWRAARGAAAGVRFPHTRTALVLGAANAALTLVAPQAPAEH